MDYFCLGQNNFFFILKPSDFILCMHMHRATAECRIQELCDSDHDYYLHGQIIDVLSYDLVPSTGSHDPCSLK